VESVLHSPLALFILQAAVVIVTSRAIGLVARRLRQPMVVAEIVAGIVLGPSLLGWLLPHASEVLFPTASLPLLGMVSQIGLVLFMFLIGLELDPKLLKDRPHVSVAISHTSIVVPFLLGALVALGLHARLSSPSVPLTSYVLFTGAAMSVTAFPVLARILVERRLLRSRVGAIAIACAAVDDVTAWCILAFVVSIVRSSDVRGAVLTSALALAYLAVMLLAVRPALGRVTRRTKIGLSQNVVAVVLVGLLASSWATELIGIHALFGAFLFGAVLPKQGSFASALAEKIEDLVVVFLLPMFFAYSGLRTQVGLLSTPESWMVCALFVAVASVGKFGGSAVAARVMGIPWRESSAIGVLMNTRGLMELIVLNIGLDLGVISPTVFTMLVIMALVTTFVTTPALQRIYPIEELAKDLAEPVDQAVPAPAPRAYTALACVAFEGSAPGLLKLGTSLAGNEPAAGRLYALHLVRSNNRASFVLEQRDGGSVPGEEATFAPLVESARREGADVRPLSFVSGDPARDICGVADVKRADVVLLGWHKPLLGTTVLSGTVHQVMKSARSDVGVFVDRGLRRIERVLVPYLGRDHDRAALRLARRLADNTGATITVLHVVQPDVRSGARERFAEEFGERAPGGRTYEVVFKTVSHATPAEAVVAESVNGYDLIVVGIGVQWGLQHRSFGIRTEAILRRTGVSVLVVRNAERPVAEPSLEARARLATTP